MKTQDIKTGQIVKARIKRTGQEVKVYRRSLGGFVDYSNCTKIYNDNELEF